MSDYMRIFNTLRRPNLLIRAARIGQTSYRRDRDLKRVLATGRTPGLSAGLGALLSLERDLEEGRVDGNTTYSISKHVEVLTALIAEASLTSKVVPLMK
jgi:hypothetical protein